MNRPSSPPRGAVAGLLAAATLVLVLAPSAQAALTGSCEGQVVEQPFIRWADPGSYVLAPNGAIERGRRRDPDGAGSWALKGAAARVPGNEDFYAHGAADAWSLALPPGSSARTARMCVGVEHPTLRLFARNRGSAASLLLVEVLFEDIRGRRRAVPVGTYPGVASWQATVPLTVVANLFAVLPGQHVDVAFRFTPLGAGDWSIDDVYVDPFRHG